MSGLLSQPDGHDHAKHFCDHCIHIFTDMSTLLQHTEDCVKFGPKRVHLFNQKNFLRTRDLWGAKIVINPTGCRKLICNLKRKERYAVHNRNLKLYGSLGMNVIKYTE